MFMYLTPLRALMLVLAGVFVGILTSFMGASGVMFVVPVLTMFFGLSIYSSIGTSLAVDVISSLAVSISYYNHGKVDLKPSILMALSAVAGAQLGGKVAHLTPELHLQWFFALSMMVGGVFVLKGGYLAVLSKHRRLFDVIRRYVQKHKAVSVLVGLIIGVVCGLLGAGGGVMFLVVLLFLYGYPTHTAIGTSTFIMTMTAASGAVSYLIHGSISAVSMALLSVGAVAVGVLMPNVVTRLSERTVNRIIGALLILFGSMMLLNGLLENLLTALQFGAAAGIRTRDPWRGRPVS